MTTEATKRQLLESIRRDLTENEHDLKRAAARYDELVVERRKLWLGYYEIKAELNSEKGAE